MINQPNRSFLQLAGDEVGGFTGGLPKMGGKPENPMAMIKALFPNGAPAGVGAAGAAEGTAGAAGGAELLPMLAMLCRAAEATFGVDDPRTNRARFAVNTEWPEWAKSLYRKHMHAAALLIGESKIARSIAAAFFTWVGKGKPEMKPDGTIKEK